MCQPLVPAALNDYSSPHETKGPFLGHAVFRLMCLCHLATICWEGVMCACMLMGFYLLYTAGGLVVVGNMAASLLWFQEVSSLGVDIKCLCTCTRVHLCVSVHVRACMCVVVCVCVCLPSSAVERIREAHRRFDKRGRAKQGQWKWKRTKHSDSHACLRACVM